MLGLRRKFDCINGKDKIGNLTEIESLVSLNESTEENCDRSPFMPSRLMWFVK